MNKTSNLYIQFVKIVLAFVLITAVIGISAAVICILFGKPIGDDYGAISLHRPETWLHSAYSSLVTTGRYGQSLAASLLYGLFGDNSPVILPLAVIVWFVILSFFYIKKLLLPYLKNVQSLNLYSFMASVVFVFLLLFVNDTPAPGVWWSYQLFFWSSGIITYTLPLLILLTCFYVLFLSSLTGHLRANWRLALYAVTLLVSSLFNEIQPATLFIISAGLLLASRLRAYAGIQKYSYLLVINMIVTGCGLIALFFSPGRLQRSQFLDTVTAPSQGSLLESVVRNVATLFQEYYARPREVVLMVVIGIIVAMVIYPMVKNKKKYVTCSTKLLQYALLLLAICAVGVITSISLIIIGYGYEAGLYPRAMLIAQLTYVLVLPLLAFSVSGLLLGRFGVNFPVKLVTLLISLCFFISIPHYFNKMLTQVNSSAAYHNAWTEQDTLLKRAASNNIRETVYLRDPASGIGDGFSLQCAGPYAKSTMWLNVQVTQYYGGQDRVCPDADRKADQDANKKWSGV